MTISARRIDHLVLAVRDLDAAAGFYESLGFQVGARNRHPWGTENRLVQFRSSFLELISVGDAALIPPHRPGHFSFGAFVRDYLARREGLAMAVLDSMDAIADAAAFADAGIGRFEPFRFERKGRRPDGTETHVAFTLAFAMDEGLPDACFFVCQQHFPDAFWNPAFQVHANGAHNVFSVTLGVPRPMDHAAFVRAFTGVDTIATAEGGLVFPLREGGRLAVEVRPDAAGFIAFGVGVPDIGPVSERLARSGVPFREGQGAITIAASHASGVEIRFAAAAMPD